MYIDTSGLKQQQLTEILHSKEYKRALYTMSEELKEEAPQAPNEKTLETRFDQYLTIIFSSLFEPLGYSYYPEKEASVDTVRAITKGRADTSIGNVIIEFKQPSTLSSETDQKKAVLQAKQYMHGFTNEGINKTFGFITDGLKSAVYYLDGSGKDVQEDFAELTAYQIGRVIEAIIGLNQKSFNSQNLVEDFAKDNNSPAHSLALSLFEELVENRSDKTTMLLSEWKHLFKLSHDDVESQQQAIIDRRVSLSNYFSSELLSVDDEYNALFALQTAYTILIKLIAFKVISQVKYNDSLVSFSRIINADDKTLRIQMANLESGSIIRDYGIQNLLEGDFFSWYVADNQWTESISNCIKKISEILNGYTNDELLDVHNAQDFFKDLYQSMIPGPVRHALGEYYTPHWLAEKVTDKALSLLSKDKHSDWRALDPTCGSGTFLTVLIQKIIRKEEKSKISSDELLNIITSRVVGIDLNPLAVLTARVNYFLNISSFITPNSELEIPVYSGDSAYTPIEVVKDGITFLKYSLDTEIEQFNILFPKSGLKNLKKFSRTMIEIELDIESQDVTAIYRRLLCLLPANEQQSKIVNDTLLELATTFVRFESKNWNGIWARIIANYLSTASLGKFDMVVGNPPWVDWKNLPSLYREKIKEMPITKTLFSGDAQTGGINLNIAALITNEVISNYLSSNGVLGMLMPDTFLVQRTYEGYRKLILPDNRRGYFQAVDDWTKAGNPFYPVTQKFYSYFISFDELKYEEGIPVTQYVKRRGKSTREEYISFADVFDVKYFNAIQMNKNTTNFTIVKRDLPVSEYRLVGKKESDYKGREGIEFYPQELLIFRVSKKTDASKMVTLENVQVKKSKFKIPKNEIYVENRYLRPLIKGVDIRPFHVESEFVVPFAYDEQYSKRVAISEKMLRSSSPKLFKYFHTTKSIFESQNTYSKKLINGTNVSVPYYSLARVGDYTFAPYFVAYRDNSKNVAAVVEKIKTPWNTMVSPVFQNHAVTISQRPDGSFISKNEAYYISGIINSSVVINFVKSSSDGRSFPINPRYQIPLYSSRNTIIYNLQNRIADLSKRAHSEWENSSRLNEISSEISKLYLKMLLIDERS